MLMPDKYESEFIIPSRFGFSLNLFRKLLPAGSDPMDRDGDQKGTGWEELPLRGSGIIHKSQERRLRPRHVKAGMDNSNICKHGRTKRSLG